MDTPHPHIPPPGHIAGKLKDPKMMAVLAVLVVGFSLYIRHRNSSSMAAPSGVGTPVTDPLSAPYSPDPTQGAASSGGTDTSGSFGGFDTPPDWYSDPPGWYTDPVTAPDPTASTDQGVVGVQAGDSIYDPHTGKLVTAPGGKKPKKAKPPAGGHHHKPTGGGPPKTHPHAHKAPPKHKPHPASKPGSGAHKPPTHVKPQAPTTRPTHPMVSHTATPTHAPSPPKQTHHAPKPPPKKRRRG